MKIKLIIVGVFALLMSASVARAKDVTITLTDQEQQVLLNLLDMAVKQGGLRVAGNAAYFTNKINPSAAQSEQAKSPLVPDAKEGKTP